MNEQVETWRRIIVGEHKSWAMFEGGTLVVLTQPGADLKEQAISLLRENGPVVVGTETADFNVIELENDLGWVVTCHHPDILTFVGRDEDASGANELVIGLIGRSIRDRDAHELNVVHVEDNTRRAE